MNIEETLFYIEKQLEGMVEASGKVIPTPSDRTDIVTHADYIIQLLGTMVSDETFKSIMESHSHDSNGIADRILVINDLLQSGEISGDIDVESLTITENGEYNPGLGKAYGKVTVDCPEDQSTAIIEGTVSGTITNSDAKKIKNCLFENTSTLTEVSFPECMSIGYNAFDGCTSLTSVSFPLCESIGEKAFMNCDSLKEVYFPSCLKIAISAFFACKNLSKATFPACTSIGNGAFYACSSLTEVSFPACISVGENAFSACSSLKEVSFPVCTSIGRNAFGQCYSLSKAFFPECTNVWNSAFYACSSLTEVSFPACKSVGQYAFNNCHNLGEMSLPVCTIIESNAFAICWRLSKLYLLGSSVCTLTYSGTFYSTPLSNNTTYTDGQYGSIYVPASLYSQYIVAPNWSNYSARFVSV